jgi:hypothetical protein
VILERVEGERLSRVLPEWAGGTVAILGGGPSLTLEQFEAVRVARESDAIRVITINDAYLLAPWADVAYAADAKWFTWHAQGIPKPGLGLTAEQVRERWATFPGQKCGIRSAEPYHAADVHVLRVSHLTGALSRDPGALSTGRQDGYAGHGGFQALNLATLAGARTVLLLGYDGRPSAEGKDNWHGAHPIPTPPSIWDFIVRSFSCIENELEAAGVRVINCSMKSAIGSFEKLELADALAA